MRHLQWMQSAALALTLTLGIASLAPTLAASGASAPVRAVVGKIDVTASSYMELKQISLLPDQSGKLAAFTITIHNQGSSELQFIDYWVRLKSKSGSKFTTRVLPADKDKNQVTPGSSMDVTYYAKVNESTALQDLIVQFIKWDFNQPSFENVIGEVVVPDSYTNVTPADEAYLMRISGTDVAASIKKLVSNKNEKYYVPTVYLNLENAGPNAVAMPAYLYSILTPEGLMYPLEIKGVKDVTINPKESKEIQLSGTIPASVPADNWQLVITENLADLKLKLPIASFALPKVAGQEEESIGKAYSFTSSSGVYTAELNAIYRLPWEDSDILTADLTLSNKGSSSLPIPELTGYFMLDGGVKVDAKWVKTSKVIALAAGSGVSFQLAGKVPYTYNFTQAKLVLQEKESETVTTEVLEFSSQSEIQAIPFHTQNESYALTDIGSQSKFTTRSVSTYAGTTGDIFTAQVEVENLEKRFSSLPKLAAHFRSPDGTIIPAAVAEVKNKIRPGGKALLNVWASLPKGFPTENMHLLLGDAVTDGKLTEGEGKPDSYVKPAAFWLPGNSDKAKNLLQDVQLFPYTISLHHIGTSINYSNLTLKFDYEITKDLTFETNTEGHKLILSFEDNKGTKSFERIYDVKDFSPAEGDSTPDDGSKLRLGKHNEFKISVNDPDLIYKLEFLKQYTLSIYDEFQGQRKPLAAQKIDWFIVTD